MNFTEFNKKNLEDELIRYLKLFGTNSLAYSTLQDGMEYFILKDKGYIAYKKGGIIKKHTFVLGDPICGKNNLEEILTEFLKKEKDPIFWQVYKSTGNILYKMGFYVNECGPETFLDPNTYTLDGPEKVKLRKALKVADEEGITLKELKFNEINEEEVRYISNNWIDRKVVNTGELAFLARPFVYGDEPDVRKFYAFDKNNKMLGFIVLNPMYNSNKIIGYCVDMIRARKDAPKAISHIMTLKVLEQLKNEGINKLSLGWSPYYHIEDNGHMNSPLLTLYLISQYQLGNNLYNFKGQAEHKREYLGKEIKTYFCSKHRLPLLAIYNSFIVCNINPIAQIKKSLFHKKK